MRRFVSAAILVSAATLTAQSPRFAQVGDPMPDGMGQLVGVADYEGDGDSDLFTASGVFLNVNGHFVRGPALSLPFYVRSIAIADFTGDNRVDVLAGGITGSTNGLALHVAPPAGGTAFTQAPAAFPAGLPLSELAALDYDSDGDVDVSAAGSSGSSQTWLLFKNNGTGTFTLAPTLEWPTANVSMSWLASGDFDGDTMPDLFATTASGGVWRHNLGGVFGPTTAVGSPLIADNGAVGDFDGDTRDDVIVIEVDGDEVVCMGSPLGPLPGTQTNGGILGPAPLAADINGDGYCDLLRSVVGVSGGTSGELHARAGSPTGLGPPFSAGNGSFAVGSPWPYIGAGVLDVDADGDPDLALATGVGVPALLVNTNNGLLLAEQTIPFGIDRLFAPPHDVDGDGDLDLVRGQIVAPFVIALDVMRNDGRGVFSGPVPAGSFGGYPARAVWSDLDGDGDADMWVGNVLSPGTGTAVLNNGAGVFTGGPSVSLPGPTNALAAGDFDGNGIPDIVVGRPWTAGFPPIFHQPLFIAGSVVGGVLTYAAPLSFGVAENVTEIVTLDAEPDGDLDLLVATTGSPRIYRNNGFGAFTTNTQFPGTATSVAAAHLNGDALIDLVLGAQVWINTGIGFSPSTTHAAPLGFLTPVDVDLDGLVDLVDSAGRWYPAVSAGTFGAPVTFVPYTPAAPVTSTAAKLVVEDFDADGDPDLVGPTEALSSLLSVYKNLTRHAGRTGLVVQNAPVQLAIWGAPGDFWVLGASFPGALPVPLPPFGTLFLDPATLAVFASGVIPAGGRFDWTGPTVPPLPGLTLDWQALVGPRLTNGFSTYVP